MSYTSFFHMQDSQQNVVENAMFKKPRNFDDRLSEVTKRIEELNMKNKSSSQLMEAPSAGYDMMGMGMNQ